MFQRLGDTEVIVDITALIIDPDQDAGRVSGVDQFVTGFRADIHRLGGDYMFTRLYGFYTDLSMQPTRGHHHHHVNISAAQYLIEIRAIRTAHLFAHFSRELLVKVNDYPQFRACGFKHLLCAVAPHPQSHYGKTCHIRLSLFRGERLYNRRPIGDCQPAIIAFFLQGVYAD